MSANGSPKSARGIAAEREHLAREREELAARREKVAEGGERLVRYLALSLIAAKPWRTSANGSQMAHGGGVGLAVRESAKDWPTSANGSQMNTRM